MVGHIKESTKTVFIENHLIHNNCLKYFFIKLTMSLKNSKNQFLRHLTMNSIFANKVSLRTFHNFITMLTLTYLQIFSFSRIYPRLPLFFYSINHFIIFCNKFLVTFWSNCNCISWEPMTYYLYIFREIIFNCKFVFCEKKLKFYLTGMKFHLLSSAELHIKISRIKWHVTNAKRASGSNCIH